LTRSIPSSLALMFSFGLRRGQRQVFCYRTTCPRNRAGFDRAALGSVRANFTLGVTDLTDANMRWR